MMERFETKLSLTILAVITLAFLSSITVGLQPPAPNYDSTSGSGSGSGSVVPVPIQ